MTVDLHAHLVSLEALAAMQDAHPEQAPRSRQRLDGFLLEYPGRKPSGPFPGAMFDVRRRLADMDARRVDMQVLAVPPPLFHYHLAPEVGADFARICNDAALAASAAHPDRLQVFATLPLQDPGAAIDEIGRIRGESAVRGVEIGTNVNGGDLDAPAFEPLWAALEEADLPVWVHAGARDVAGGQRLASYYLSNLVGIPIETTLAVASLIFGGVVQRHPHLRFGFVHGGGFVPYVAGRWDHGWARRPEPRANISQPPSSYLSRLFFDTLTHDRDALALLGRRVGWRQIVLGSDYPFDMSDPDPVAAVEALGLTGADEAGVLAGNAQRFLRPRP